MKTIKVIKYLFLVSLCVFVSCKPEKPKNEAEDRGHEMPSTTIYTLTEGTLSNENAIGSNGKNRKYLGDGFLAMNTKVQTVKFKQVPKNNGSELVREGDGFEMKPDVWYQIKVDFINKSGENINSQYYETEEARRLHQFFFRSFEYEEGKTVDRMLNRVYGEDNIFVYRYGDKMKNGSLMDPPIGFVGYIKYVGNKSDKLKGKNKIVLNPFLVHSMSSSKLTFDKETKELVPYPFDDPGKNIIGISDIDHRIPVTLLK